MQQLGQDDRARHAQPHHRAVQSLGPVEGFVGQGVEDVEARHPGRHGDGDRRQRPPRRAPVPGDGEIPPDRRNGQAQAEPDMRPPGEALGKAVDHHPGERERSKQGTERIEGTRRRRGMRPPPPPRTPTPALPSAPPSGARGCWCADSARRTRRSAIRLNPIATQRAAVNAATTSTYLAHVQRCHSRCGQHAEQRERQREQGVRKLHEVGEPHDQRFPASTCPSVIAISNHGRRSPFTVHAVAVPPHAVAVPLHAVFAPTCIAHDPPSSVS